MGKSLVVVESPAKAKTIKKYLGQGYEVMASKGHVRDLPKKLGIDIENDFEETYEVIETKAKVLSELKSAVKKADELVLATDPDREGEAIAWHIADELKRPKLSVKRVDFHEITKRGVEHGVKNPRELDKHLYDAQRARRVLDRIVGYDVSALVWSKLSFGLSAGRVQSVALRLIVEREREIEAFVPEEYWNVGATLIGKAKHSFFARLTKADDKKIEVKSGEQAAAIRADLESADFSVLEVDKREQKRKAPAPYTTSKLQQDATSYLRFTAKRTMSIAQRLYEGVDLKKDGGQVGLITYMRTDSMRLSADAVNEARAYIQTKHGKDHLPDKPNIYRSKKANVQDAHEAIRPTSVEYPPERVKKHLTDEQFKLYKLIWDRFIASQMVPAVYDQTGVEIAAAVGRKGGAHRSYRLRATGKVLKFGGWLDQYQKSRGDGDTQTEFAGEGEDDAADAKNARSGSNGQGKNGSSNGGGGKADAEDEKERTLPEILQGESLRLTEPGVSTEQKFTQPPPRYNEGSLVRELERRGIGRPSTYAEIISKVQARDYVEKLPGGQMKATQLGKMVVDGLVSTELDFMDPGFTAKMEEDLDQVEEGKLDRVALLKRFYARFSEELSKAKKAARWVPDPEPTEFKCEECGSTMNKRWSKNGWFLGCERYPKCKFTQNLGEDGKPEKPKLTDYTCDECGKPMVIKSGRYGQFLSCSGYPECKTTRPLPLGVPCPECGGDIVEIRPKKRGGRTFYGCANYPKCEFKTWQKPIDEPCPLCKHPFLVVAGGKKNPKIACPRGKECGYSRGIDEPPPNQEAKKGSARKGQQEKSDQPSVSP